MVTFKYYGEGCVIGGLVEDKDNQCRPSENKTPKLILILRSGHGKDWGTLESTYGGTKSECPEQLLKRFFSLNVKESVFNTKHHRQLQHRQTRPVWDIPVMKLACAYHLRLQGGFSYIM